LEYNETVYQLFIGFTKIYDSIRRKYSAILIEFGGPMKVVRLIEICLNGMYDEVHIGKYLSDNFPVQNGLKQEYALWPMLFNFSLVYAIGKVQESQVGLKLNGTRQLLDYADDVNLLEGIADTTGKT
jgi:hypothetical protein